eukprot:scaffold1367_cov104-Isochrysis_galbana.AAC.5
MPTALLAAHGLVPGLALCRLRSAVRPVVDGTAVAQRRRDSARRGQGVLVWRQQHRPVPAGEVRKRHRPRDCAVDVCVFVVSARVRDLSR